LSSLDPKTTARISPSVYARAFGEELVLLDFSRGEYFGLDETATTIWRALEAGKTLGEIADTLVERYDVSREVALGDVSALISHMTSESLLTVVP
jgi:hypothetical protein